MDQSGAHLNGGDSHSWDFRRRNPYAGHMGRPSKGLRTRLTIRIAAHTAQDAALEAERRGMTLNDWTAWAIRMSIPRSQRVPARRPAKEAS
jgi:hypothetical protein